VVVPVSLSFVTAPAHLGYPGSQGHKTVVNCIVVYTGASLSDVQWMSLVLVGKHQLPPRGMYFPFTALTSCLRREEDGWMALNNKEDVIIIIITCFMHRQSTGKSLTPVHLEE